MAQQGNSPLPDDTSSFGFYVFLSVLALSLFLLLAYAFFS